MKPNAYLTATPGYIPALPSCGLWADAGDPSGDAADTNLLFHIKTTLLVRRVGRAHHVI